MDYNIIWVRGHVEVYDWAGRFCFSADSEREAMEELACEAATIDFGFMAVVANLGAVEEEAGRWMLEVLAEGCERRAEAVEGAAASAESIEAREALGLYGRVFRLTSSWLRRLRRTYYRNQRKLQRRAQRVRRDGARGL